MIISIDESGTHKQDGFSVIALVCVEDSDALHKLNIDVEQLGRAISTTNFHWAIKGWPFRRDFIQGLAQLRVKVRLAKIANPIKLERTLEEVLPYLISERHIEGIFIDGKKHRQYARVLKKVLRDKGITVKKLRTVDDVGYPTIRVADAVAGAVRYYLDNPNKRAAELYTMIEPLIEFIHIQK